MTFVSNQLVASAPLVDCGGRLGVTHFAWKQTTAQHCPPGRGYSDSALEPIENNRLAARTPPGLYSDPAFTYQAPPLRLGFLKRVLTHHESPAVR